jgi:hypothetical protein
MRSASWLLTSLLLLVATVQVSAQEGLGAGFRFQPCASVFLTGSDPHRQLTPVFMDVRSGDAVDPAVRALVGAELDIYLGRYLTLGIRSHYDSEATNSPLAGRDGALTVGRKRLG